LNGIHVAENLNREQFSAARAYEFAFIVQPLKLKAATGSTAVPAASADTRALKMALDLAR
jgi:hypothetical protein